MAVISPPPNNNDPDSKLGAGFAEFFSNAYKLLFDLQSSGTTAQRPTKRYAGQFFFDKSLGANGKPIWVNAAGTGWVLADGTPA